MSNNKNGGKPQEPSRDMEEKLEQLDTAEKIKYAFKKTFKLPAFYFALACLAVIAALEVLMPLGTLKTISITVFSSLLGALILLIVFDIRNFEKRLNDLNNASLIDTVAKVLSFTPSAFDTVSQENLKRLRKQATISAQKLANGKNDSDMNQIVDLCFSEMDEKLKGIFSSNVVIDRHFSPHFDSDGKVDSWKIRIETTTTLKNGSQERRAAPHGGTLTSSPIMGNPKYADYFYVKKYVVTHNDDIVFHFEDTKFKAEDFENVENPPGLKCTKTSDGTRIWENRFPTDSEIPNELEPGESLTYQFVEEFYIPPKEEVRVRWSSPRKGIVFTTHLEGITDVKPVVTLTGCSICERKRKHRCQECNKSDGRVTIDPNNSVTILNSWAGSEMGVNVNWEYI